MYDLKWLRKRLMKFLNEDQWYRAADLERLVPYKMAVSAAMSEGGDIPERFSRARISSERLFLLKIVIDEMVADGTCEARADDRGRQVRLKLPEQAGSPVGTSGNPTTGHRQQQRDTGISEGLEPFSV